MARRRVVDWKKLAEKFGDRPCFERLVWEGILACVDDFGLCAWSPIQIGLKSLKWELDHRKVSVRRIEAIMEAFAAEDDPGIVAWEHNGRRYFALTKHQDYQRVRLPGNADCPCPPPEILQRLSVTCRAHIESHLQKFTSFGVPQITAEVEVEVEVEVEDEVEVEGEKNPAVSGKTNPVAKFLDGYGRLYQKHHGAKPTITRGKDARIAQAMISEAGSVETALGIIEVGLVSTDPFLRDGGYSLGVLKTKWAGLKLAHEKGQAHGSAGKEIKRQDAGPRDQDWAAR